MSAPSKYAAFAALGAVYIGWLVAAASQGDAHAAGDDFWAGEDSFVERFEVAVLAADACVWAWLAVRLHRLGGPHRRARVLVAVLMVPQLVVILGEELDWGGVIPGYRNLRMLARVVVPEVLDGPLAGAYLLAFLFAPWVPLARVRAFQDRVAPVRAERADGLATFLGPPLSLLSIPLVGDAGLGELHQLGIYAILVVVTARITHTVLVVPTGNTSP